MITLFLLMPAAAFFMIANVIVGCYVAIRLGYGPPNWQTALNLVVSVTVLQDRLNRCRVWLEKKAPWTDMLLHRLHVPKPYLIVDPAAEEESAGDSYEEQIEELAAVPIDKLLEGSRIESPQTDVEPPLYDESLRSAVANQSTLSWFMNDKNAETSLLKLNAVLMKSGRFAAELEGKIRDSVGTLTEEDLKTIITHFMEDCRVYLSTQAELVKDVSTRVEEFGEFQTLAKEIADADSNNVSMIESMLKDMDAMTNRPPNEGTTRLLQELSALRRSWHQLRDLRERVFTLTAAKENRLGTIPKQLYVDELSGQRGRIGLMATLYDWWKSGRQKGRFLTFALVDFVQFGAFNDNYGTLTGDKIIKHFGNGLKEHFDGGDLLGIYYGNAFLTVTIHAGMQKTVTAIEHLRQRQMKTVYQTKGGGQSIQVLLTGAIVETSGEQSVEEVLALLDKTMAAAKAAGRNHTFCWNIGASQPEKTESPDFGEQEQIVHLE